MTSILANLCDHLQEHMQQKAPCTLLWVSTDLQSGGLRHNHTLLSKTDEAVWFSVRAEPWEKVCYELEHWLRQSNLYFITWHVKERKQ